MDLDTWTDVQWTKVNWMQGAMGLTPWYQTATGAAQASPPPPVVRPCTAQGTLLIRPQGCLGAQPLTPDCHRHCPGWSAASWGVSKLS